MWTFFYISLMIGLTFGNIRIAPFYNNPLNDGMTCAPKDAIFEREAGSVLLCSALCKKNSICLSFFYNKETKTCSGCLAAYDTRVELGTHTASRYYSDIPTTDLITSTTSETTSDGSATTSEGLGTVYVTSTLLLSSTQVPSAKTTSDGPEKSDTSSPLVASTSAESPAEATTLEFTSSSHIPPTSSETEYRATPTLLIPTSSPAATSEMFTSSETKASTTNAMETPHTSTLEMETSTLYDNGGWVQFQERLYLFVDQKLSVDEAFEYCKLAKIPTAAKTKGRRSVRLVVVETKEENEFVQELITASKEDVSMILLGMEFDEKGVHVLNVNELIAYANWYKHQPDDTNGHVLMGNNGQWYRSISEKAMPFVCEATP